jgi:tRNA A64-2'-O-ribosylphosphate transferase
VQGAEASEGGYIQGAADDHEAWSHGLTPPLFWKHKDLLMSTGEEDAPAVISKIIDEEAQTSTTSPATLIKPTTNLYISSSQNVDLTDFVIVISCDPTPLPAHTLKAAGVKHYLPLKCNATPKLGSRDLRSELPRLVSFLSSLPLFAYPPKMLVCCPTGKDLSVGTTLAILCLYSSDRGATYFFLNAKPRNEIDKNYIKHRLSWITTSNPALNPSRATLQSVNTVLLSSHDPKAHYDVPLRPSIPEKKTNANANLQANIFSNWSNTSWTLHRTLTSSLPTHPSGTVTGTATFTRLASLHNFSPTLAYQEVGEFVMDNGMRASARRRYTYQLVTPKTDMDGEGGSGKGDDGIVVRFSLDDTPAAERPAFGAGDGLGGVFVQMGPLSPSPSPPSSLSTLHEEEGVMVAENKEQHLCAADLYAASWKFSPAMMTTSGEGGGEGEMWWEVRYDVKGPKKGYVSVTRYSARVKGIGG